MDIDLTRATEATEEVKERIEDLFNYHPWDEAQQKAGQRVRNSLANAYAEIIDNVPPCPQRTRALNMLVDSRMLANSAITHKGSY